jgi:ribosomal protein S18 acetylase RimI-like enzyme
VTIRDARPDELDTVVELWRAGGLRLRGNETTATMIELQAREDAWLLVAEADGALAGTLIATYDGWRGHFYRLAVAPAFRRRGIARALVGEGERRLAAVGARRLTSIVVLENDEGVGFWTSAGYPHEREVGRFKKELG